MNKKIIIAAAIVILVALVVFFAMQTTPGNVLNAPRAESLEIKDGVLIIPEEYTVIDFEVFAGKIDFSRVEIKGDAELGERCFYGCPNLETVIIDGECTVGSEAFGDCGSLKSVRFNSKNAKCEDNAFNGHSGIMIYCRENSGIVDIAQKMDISYKIIGEE